jgi:cysteinyl-tRNA synthetase
MKIKFIKRNKLNFFGSKKLNIIKYSSWIEPKGKPTGIFLKNSLTNSKTELKRIDNSILSWYSCGPTVYDHSHLGHARNYICIDIIQRILKNYFNLPLYHLMGVTDVDDKIIKKAKEEEIEPLELARFYEKKFFGDLISLNVKLPQTTLRVSEHISKKTKKNKKKPKK